MLLFSPGACPTRKALRRARLDDESRLALDGFAVGCVDGNDGQLFPYGEPS